MTIAAATFTWVLLQSFSSAKRGEDNVLFVPRSVEADIMQALIALPPGRSDAG
jgi:hypothetical protein